MKVILAFSNTDTTSKIKYLLSTNEVTVFESYSTFKDLYEAYANYDDLIIICQYKFKDGSILDIDNKASKNSYIICVSNKLDEEFTKSINSYILRTPVDVNLLTSLVNMIFNINTIENINSNINGEYISSAKEILIRDFYFSENEAHKTLQRLSMNLCVNKNLLSKVFSNSFGIDWVCI